VKQLPAGSARERWIYEANNKGYPGSAGNTTWTCPTGTCIKYLWNNTTRVWDYSSGSYLASNQNACGASPDEMGIRVVARHTFVTRLFGTSFDLHVRHHDQRRLLGDGELQLLGRDERDRHHHVDGPHPRHPGPAHRVVRWRALSRCGGGRGA